MPSRPARAPWEAVLAVLLVSFCTLAAEVALTRVFSVLFRAPYVFLIVSGAIGGLGLGGLVVQWVRPREERLGEWIVGLCVALAAALALPVLVLFASPWGRDLVAQAETAVVVSLPMVTFCVAGMLLALIFRAYPEQGGFLYFIDLAAAAAAAPISVFLLDRVSGIDAPLVLAAGAALAGLVLALRARRDPDSPVERAAGAGRFGRTLWAGLAGVGLASVLGVLGTDLATRWITLPLLQMPASAAGDPSHPWHLTTKPLFAELADPFTSSRIVRTDWTAVARTDVVHDPGQKVYYIYTDGDVPTQMEPWDGSLETARGVYGDFIGALPYKVRATPPERVMAIGSGGGLDVLLALSGGAKQVDALEINPSIPRVVADPRFEGTYARVYREPNVRLVVDEGRSFLQRAGKYDQIYFACAKTATTQTGGLALLDNHLYTVEAFRDYWNHLTEDGMLALVVQESFLIDRLLITAVRALGELGVAEPARHLVTAGVPPERFGMGPYRFILMMRRKPWESADAARLQSAIQGTGLRPLHVPHLQSVGGNEARFDPAATPRQLQAALEAQYPIPLDPEKPDGPKTNAFLGPVTDDRPFYVDVARGLHPMLQQLLWGAGIAAVVVFALTLLAGLVPGKAGDADARPSVGLAGAGILYFSMLGAGFMFVELALMQRFVLLLGYPTRSLSVTLFALLVSSALGSRFSQRGTPVEAGRRLRRLLPVLVLLVGIYQAALGPVLSLFLPLPLPVRALVTFVLLFPAGFLMGMPFPTALRTLSGAGERLIPAFWSVNGVASILGSVATMALAKFTGYSGTLLVGAGCYVVAWLVFPLLARGRGSTSGTALPEAQPAAV